MKKNYCIALSGILLAIACGISYIESVIPLPLPLGAKPGLASIVIMFSIIKLDLKNTFAITLLKSVFVLFIRGITAFTLSLCGGLISLIIMLIIYKLTDSSYILMSSVGAVFHNVGQLLAAGFIYYHSFSAVTAYMPVLIITGCITGAFTGSVLGLLLKRLNQMPDN